MLHIIKEILISEEQFTETNYKRLEKGLAYIEKNLIDSDSCMYLTVNSLLKISSIITGSNNITFRKVFP